MESDKLKAVVTVPSIDNLSHDDLANLKKNIKQAKQNKYESQSKDRLKKVAQAKIKTTMIGSLSIIEKHFGFLWGLDEFGDYSGVELSEQEELLKQMFEKVRNEILDNGNTQLRNLLVELDQYDVNWNRYSIKLEVKPEG